MEVTGVCVAGHLLAILACPIEEWHVEDDIYNLSTIFPLLRDLEDQRLIQRRLKELKAFRRPLLKRKGSLLPPSYTMATGPRACAGFAAWTRRNGTILQKHHPALYDVVASLRLLRFQLNPEAGEFSPATKRKGRFDSLPFSNGEAFKSIDEKDACVSGMKCGTPWKSTSS